MAAETSGDTDYAVPTGEFIREWLDENEMPQAELARRMGLSAKHVSKLLGGAPLTADVATQLSLVTGVPARVWLGYEATYRSDVARLGLITALSGEVDLVKLFPLKDLRARGYVTATLRHPGVVLLELFAFFGVGSVDALKACVARPSVDFRQGTKYDVDEAALATWLRITRLEVEASDFETLPPFDKASLSDLLPEIRGLSVHPPQHFGAKLVERLRFVGVHLQYVPEVKGSRVFGATEWVGGSPVVSLTLRGVNDGQFWFTLFHELGHILLHPKAKVLVNEAGAPSGVSKKSEWEANQFAGETLIPSKFAQRLESLETDRQVASFASSIGVSAGVVVGRLWHQNLWDYKRGHNLCKRLMLTDN